MSTNTEGSVWGRHPEAERYVLELLGSLSAELPQVGQLEQSMLASSGTRLSDWLDHLVVADAEGLTSQLLSLGFVPEQDVEAPAKYAVYYHPGAALPRLLLTKSQESSGTTLSAAISVDDIASFLVGNRVQTDIEGTPLAPFRRATVWKSEKCRFQVVERRGYGGYVPHRLGRKHADGLLRAMDRWSLRLRRSVDREQAMLATLDLARSLVVDVGVHLAAWAFIAAELACWQQRCWAGQVQKNHQDRLGLGWANRDHCAFRSSRETFSLLIEFLETLGFQPRERFYAGAEAGWGAQVMEQPTCRFAVFADVDLSPDEIEGDFAHRGLPPRHDLGTIGLWCALHGEAILDAGAHHFAARVAFDAAVSRLKDRVVATMRPFSDFPYLRQAFTKGERWFVAQERLDELRAVGQLESVAADRMRDNGAVGSHIELIERNDGFRGFNQQTVSDIISRTDPRAQ